jgi:hypothetical protein
MPSSLDGDLSLLGYWPDDMPSGHLDPLDPFRYLGLLSQLGYLNILDPKPIDIPLHVFIQEEEDP